jgi:hypothetical protein
MLSAVACLALATAAYSLPASADAGGQPASAKALGLDPDTRVKLPPPSLGPDKMELNNNEVSEPQAGPTQRSVVRGGCIFPFGSVKYRLFTGAPQIYTFKAIPTRNFDVVMRIDTSGVHKTVDRYFAGGTETYRIRTFVRNLPVTVVIKGFLGSSGCYTFAVTP